MVNFIEQQNKLQVENNQIGLSWIGQAGFGFKDAENIIYHIDPYLSNACSRTVGYHRMIPPPVEGKEMKTDYVFFTHGHKDHLDPDSVPDIFKTNPTAMFIGPPTCIKILTKMNIPSNRMVTIERGQCKTIGNAQVKAVRAIHTDDSVGYVFNVNGVKFYITGDTTYSDDLITPIDKDLDLIMTCINGRLGCMNIPDAARLTAHIQPHYAIPMHVGMFKENTADPQEFIRQVEAYSGITKGFIMEHGRWYLFTKHNGFD